jgi:hypothetical protein
VRWPDWKWRAALVGGGCLIGLAGCGPEPVTLPSPPLGTDVAAVSQSYQMPTAVLDTSQIDQTYTAVRSALDNLPVDWLPPLVSDLLTTVHNRLDAAGLPSTPNLNLPVGAKVTAVVSVNRVCNGWDGSSTPDQGTNGSVSATAVVQNGVLQPLAWATAQQCHQQVMPSTASSAINQAATVNGFLDGALEFYLLGQLPSVTNGAQLLVVFQGTLGVNDHTASASFDMQLAVGFVKFKVSVNNGYVVVTLMGPTLAIDGANASFSCDIASATCQRTN